MDFGVGVGGGVGEDDSNYCVLVTSSATEHDFPPCLGQEVRGHDRPVARHQARHHKGRLGDEEWASCRSVMCN